MPTDASRPSPLPWITVAAAVALAAGLVGFALARRQTPASAPGTGPQILLLESDIRGLEAQIGDLKKKLAALEARPAAPAATPAPQSAAVDPAVTAQLNAISSAMTALADGLKAQQAALAAQHTANAQSTPTTAPPTPSSATAPAVPATRPKPPPVPAPVNSLEAAYKQAWETDRPVIVGQTKNPQTGKPEGGRTLDPAQAKVLGLASWQEWYASEEKARRAELEEEAAKERAISDGVLVEIPKTAPK